MPDFRVAMQEVNKNLAEVMLSDGTPLVDHLWSAVNETIALSDCQVFTYIPDLESDPFSLGCLYVPCHGHVQTLGSTRPSTCGALTASCRWSFNYFFVNTSLKKILYFTCIARFAADAIAAAHFRVAVRPCVVVVVVVVVVAAVAAAAVFASLSAAFVAAAHRKAREVRASDDEDEDEEVEEEEEEDVEVDLGVEENAYVRCSVDAGRCRPSLTSFGVFGVQEGGQSTALRRRQCVRALRNPPHHALCVPAQRTPTNVCLCVQKNPNRIDIFRVMAQHPRSQTRHCWRRETRASFGSAHQR